MGFMSKKICYLRSHRDMDSLRRSLRDGLSIEYIDGMDHAINVSDYMFARALNAEKYEGDQEYELLKREIR